ncbi:MAG TPA: amidohydrolase family protein [Gemmatimonadaceae bacterium]
MSVPRIDAHQHFWRFDPVRDAWITPDMAAIRRDFLPDDLAPLLAAQQMDGCIAVQADQSEQETQFLLGLAREHAFIRGVVGWVDLRARDLDDRLARLAADPLLRGVRHIAQAEADDFFLRDDVVRGIARLREFELGFDILVYERQLPAAIALADRLPEQTFVLDHLGKPRIRDAALEPWATNLRELARRPNVWCKLSGLVTEADWPRWRPADLRPYLDVAFDAFGLQRLMFGSDWPVCLVAGDYARVLGAVEAYASALSAGERSAVFGGNAARCYGVHVELDAGRRA